MEKLSDEQYRLARALKKVESIKSYAMHVAAYIMMNAFILIAWAVDSGLPESFFRTSVFMIAVCGGIGLLVHSIIHFGNIALFGKKWEEHTLRKFLEKDKYRKHSCKK